MAAQGQGRRWWWRRRASSARWWWWRRRGSTARWRRGSTAAATATAAARRGSSTARGGSTSSSIAQSPGARRRLCRRRSICQFSGKESLSPRAFRDISTGWSPQPVPKGYWYRFVAQTGTKGPPGPPKLARESPDLWYRLVAPTGTKGFFSFLFLLSFPLFFFSCFIKKTITFERKVQMT